MSNNINTPAPNHNTQRDSPVQCSGRPERDAPICSNTQRGTPTRLMSLLQQQQYSTRIACPPNIQGEYCIQRHDTKTLLRKQEEVHRVVAKRGKRSVSRGTWKQYNHNTRSSNQKYQAWEKQVCLSLTVFNLYDKFV